MYAEKLRQMAQRGQYGHARKPHNFYISDLYVSYDESGARNVGVAWEDWPKVVALSRRYRQFVTYCREVAPGWVEVDKIYWADNSVDSVQVDKDGNKRHVSLAAPSGDVCF